MNDLKTRLDDLARAGVRTIDLHEVGPARVTPRRSGLRLTLVGAMVVLVAAGAVVVIGRATDGPDPVAVGPDAADGQWYQPSGGMDPTIEIGDVFATTTHFDPLRRGDIVVFTPPSPAESAAGGSDRAIAKRIIGLPGDVVEGRDGKVWINGAAIDEPYLHGITTADFGPETVPAGSYFVLGDNRPESRDSRHFGVIPRVDIHALVLNEIEPSDYTGTIPEAESVAPAEPAGAVAVGLEAVPGSVSLVDGFTLRVRLVGSDGRDLERMDWNGGIPAPLEEAWFFLRAVPPGPVRVVADLRIGSEAALPQCTMDTDVEAGKLSGVVLYFVARDGSCGEVTAPRAVTYCTPTNTLEIVPGFEDEVTQAQQAAALQLLGRSAAEASTILDRNAPPLFKTINVVAIDGWCTGQPQEGAGPPYLNVQMANGRIAGVSIGLPK